MSVALSADAADLKHASAIDRQYTAASLRPVQFGKFGDENSVSQLLRECQSCSMMATIRWWQGNDHVPNLVSNFVPYIKELYAVKENKLIVEHMMLLLPPEELNQHFQVEKMHLTGTWRNSDHVDKRWACFSNVEIEIDFAITGDMKLLMQLTGRDYSNSKKSSPYHSVLHQDTGKILKCFALPPNVSLHDVWAERWPHCRAMLEIIRAVNDSSNDVQDLLLRPEQVEIRGSNDMPLLQEETWQSAMAAFNCNAGVRSRRRKRNVDQAAKKEWIWADDRLRELLPDFDDARSQVDTGSEEEALHHKSDQWRLVFIPNVPEFTEDHLEDSIIDENSITSLLGVCVLHADMRACELIASEIEAPIREALAQNASFQSIVDLHFNTVMKDHLKVRHAIRRNEDGQVRRPSFNGGASKALRTDWARKASLSELAVHRRTGMYPSQYFCAVFQTLVRVDPHNALLHKLPELADCAQHFASAIEACRCMKPSAEAYDKVDFETAMFVSKWRLLGHPLKGYGFHLWATVGRLFRKFKYLEPLSQAAVEGNNERMNRHLPRICKSPSGSYKQADIDAGPDRIAAVLAERRRNLKSICRAMYEFCTCETVSFIILPSFEPNMCTHDYKYSWLMLKYVLF